MADNADALDMNTLIRLKSGALRIEEPEPEVEDEEAPPAGVDYGSGARPLTPQPYPNQAMNDWIRGQHSRSRLAPVTVEGRLRSA